MYRIIISHNQTEELRCFPSDAPTFVVLDAHTVADLEMCEMLHYNPVIVKVQGGRGQNRNAGLERLVSMVDLCTSDIIEFFDGDRFPIAPYSTSLVESLMHRNNLDVLLYTCNNDKRVQSLNLEKGSTYMVDTGSLCNPFYSCGFAMTASAIGKVKAFNGGHLFEPLFTGWGCEDQYLGILCSHLGLSVGITTEFVLNGAVGGTENLHPDYRASLQTYIDLVQAGGFAIRNTSALPKQL